MKKISHDIMIAMLSILSDFFSKKSDSQAQKWIMYASVPIFSFTLALI